MYLSSRIEIFNQLSITNFFGKCTPSLVAKIFQTIDSVTLFCFGPSRSAMSLLFGLILHVLLFVLGLVTWGLFWPRSFRIRLLSSGMF